MKSKPKRKKVTLADTIKAAHRAGVRISYSLEPKGAMPIEFPDDPEPVKLLIVESRRMSEMGNRWNNAKIPNPRAAEACYGAGWAHALSAAWLRAKFKGQFMPDKL